MTKTTILIPIDSSKNDLKTILDNTLKVTALSEADMLIVDIAEKSFKKKIPEGVRYEHYAQSKNIVSAVNYAVEQLDTTDNDIILLDNGYPTKNNWIQQLKQVSSMSQKNAIIGAKSNIMSAQIDAQHIFNISLTEEQFDATVGGYPEYTLCPILPSPILYLRRDLIQNLGLFNELFETLEDAKIEYSLRLSPYTMSSVVAHKVFGRSLKSDETHTIDPRIEGAYRFLPSTIVQFSYNNIYALDRFIDVLTEQDVIKVNFSMLRVPATYNGTSRNALSFLKYIIAHKTSKVEFTVTATQEVIDFFKLDAMELRVLTPEQIHERNEKFHVGYAPCQPFYINEILFLNKFCLKIVVSHLDVISLRRIRDVTEFFDVRSGTMEYLEWVDGVINISNYTNKDTKDYFYPLKIDDSKLITIHQGYPGATFDLDEDVNYEYNDIKKVLSGDYIFMSGHSDPHKAVDDAVRALSKEGSPIPVIILGTRSGSDKDKNLYFMKSGGVPESLLQKVQAGARMFLFPSYAEGFGFPIAEAAHYNTPIILNDTEIAREIAGIYPDVPAYFFSRFAEVPGIVREIIAMNHSGKRGKSPIRTLDVYNKEVIDYILKVVKQPIDIDRLQNRINHFVNIDNFIGISHIGTTPTVDAPWLLILKLVVKKIIPKRTHAPIGKLYKSVKPRVKKLLGKQ